MLKLLLLSTLFAQNHWPEHRGDLQAISLGTGGGYLSGDVCVAQATSDIPTSSHSISSQPAYEQATGANQTGGSKLLCTGIGTRQLNTFAAGLGNDIYNFTYTTTEGVSATVALTANVSWVCGPTAAECALNFKTALNAHAVASNGLTAICDDATCSTLAVYLQFDSCKMCSYSHSITDVGAVGTFANTVLGNDGKIILPAALNTSTSIIQFTNGSGIGTYSPTGISVNSSDGTRVLAVTPSGIFTNGQFISSNGGPGIFGELRAQIEEDLTAGPCTATKMAVDIGGANRENCRCNSAGTGYDCCTINAVPTCTTNGPID